MKFKLKPPGTKRLKLKCHVLLSSFAFKFNLRRYIVALAACAGVIGAALTHASVRPSQPLPAAASRTF